MLPAPTICQYRYRSSHPSSSCSSPGEHRSCSRTLPWGFGPLEKYSYGRSEKQPCSCITHNRYQIATSVWEARKVCGFSEMRQIGRQRRCAVCLPVTQHPWVKPRAWQPSLLKLIEQAVRGYRTSSDPLQAEIGTWPLSVRQVDRTAAPWDRQATQLPQRKPLNYIWEKGLLAHSIVFTSSSTSHFFFRQCPQRKRSYNLEKGS